MSTTFRARAALVIALSISRINRTCAGHHRRVSNFTFGFCVYVLGCLLVWNKQEVRKKGIMHLA